jgi:hypothetical protein
MDAISTALTTAWLEAVHRVQSVPSPVPKVASAEQTLTDVIESGLRHGGIDSKEPTWVDPMAPGQLIDKHV